MIIIDNSRLRDFQNKRMQIFRELVRKFWHGEIKDNIDLEKLTDEIKNKYSFEEEDIPFIKDHIRIAMGLDPTGNQMFGDEIDLVRNFKVIHKPVIAKVDRPCRDCKDHQKCQEACKYEAQVYRRNIGPVIENNKCLSCGQCVTNCDFGALADKVEFIPLINLLQDDNTDVYATVAPAIVGQFGDEVSIGKLRTALKLLGFRDMIEVAMFADILTIREAFEFDGLVKTEEDFFLTSCCCPVWWNLTKKNYPEIFTQMSPSVSPMIASGRFLKAMYKDAKVVFISPCIAKKSEVKEPEVGDAIDFVLLFPELKEIFGALEIRLEDLYEENKDQASYGGRIYARTGGVSFSVKSVVNRIAPLRVIKLKAKKVNGVKECNAILKKLVNKENIDANFIEGMGCEGGCVGGPRTMIDKDRATAMVNEFGEESFIMTPFDNLNIMKILRELGMDRIEEIMENEEVSRLLRRG